MINAHQEHCLRVVVVIVMREGVIICMLYIYTHTHTLARSVSIDNLQIRVGIEWLKNDESGK